MAYPEICEAVKANSNIFNDPLFLFAVITTAVGIVGIIITRPSKKQKTR